MEERRQGAGPLLIIIVLAVGAAGGLLFGWWLPKQARERIARNERAASAALKMLASAEADFRGNDRDGNRVQDFWVADLAGLYVHGMLIDFSLAAADARPLAPLVPRPVPKSGYLFVAMEFQEGPPGSKDRYAQDTDGSGRKVHNTSKFGFCAYPAQYGVTGRNTFIINEGNTVFKFDARGSIIGWPEDPYPPSDGWDKIE